MAPERTEDPDAALAAVKDLLFGLPPSEGSRHDALTELAHRAAEAGQSNDWIVLALHTACELWGKYPRPFDRWTRILNLVRLVRRTYPNGPNGEGWRPAGGDE
jgi:hypothetical protein